MISEYLNQDLNIIAEYIYRSGMEGKTVMVTGAAGLIGSITVRALMRCNEKYDARIRILAVVRDQTKALKILCEGDKTIHGQAGETECVNDGSAGMTASGLQLIVCDLRDPLPDDIDADYIIHTAAPTASKFFMTNPVEVMDSIYMGTANVLKFASEKKVQGMVYLSSMEAFGSVDREDRIEEKELGYIDLEQIRSCYSEGKRISELMCCCYAKEYGVPVRIARLAQTFGPGILPGENRVFAQFARSVKNNENIVLHTTGGSMGNYIYTVDAIKAIFLLLHRGEPGQAYTVVNEETTRRIREVGELVINTFAPDRLEIIFDIPEDNRFGYAPDTQMRLSSNKLRKLGWYPETDLKEMFERIYPEII